MPRAASRVGRRHLVHVHPVQDRLGDRALVVRRRDPDHLARIDRDFGEFVGEAAGGVVLEQAVQRAERVVRVFAAGLVDLVDHHHRVGVLAVDQRLEHLAGPRALPLARCARKHPAGGERAHRQEAHAGAEQPCQLTREVRLADSRCAKQEQRRDLQRVAAVLAQRELAPDVVEHVGEVRQLVVQVVHDRHARRLDLEALGALLQHALVGRAQAFVFLRRPAWSGGARRRRSGRRCASARSGCRRRGVSPEPAVSWQRPWDTSLGCTHCSTRRDAPGQEQPAEHAAIAGSL